jgi:hypothetical protein
VSESHFEEARPMRKLTLAFVLPLALAACGKDSSSTINKDLLSRYRGAIPSESQLAAKKPQGSTTRAVGDPARYPANAGPVAIQINLAAVGIIQLMRTITNFEPTLYNSTTKEFLWGPWDNNDDFGTVAAYVQEQPAGADFQYVYALVRGVSNDLATMKPVIWGAATPDPTNVDNGVGITLWDFEANYDFAKTNDPDFALKRLDRGRFVAIYAAGEDPQKPGARMAWDFSVFRNFIAKEDYVASQDPLVDGKDLDYLYGHYVGTDQNVLDFLHFQFPLNTDAQTTLFEDYSVQMAFINSGWGRAEVLVKNGDLVPPANYAETECWNDGLKRTYLGKSYTDPAGTTTPIPGDGTEQDCGPDVGGGTMLFARTLAELGIPTLDDVDPEMKTKLEDVAENGLPQQ